MSGRPAKGEAARKVEHAISIIQLLGTREQIRLSGVFMEAMKGQPNAKLDPLLGELRADLRREIDLEEITDDIVWLRIGDGYE